MTSRITNAKLLEAITRSSEEINALKISVARLEENIITEKHDTEEIKVELKSQQKRLDTLEKISAAIAFVAAGFGALATTLYNRLFG